MGISGAALAMALGYLISSIYISTYFFSSRRTLKFIKLELTKSVRYLVDICKTGFSSSSIALYQSLKLIIINFIILGALANVGLVAFNMCCNAQLLVSIFIFGTSQNIFHITIYTIPTGVIVPILRKRPFTHPYCNECSQDILIVHSGIFHKLPLHILPSINTGQQIGKCRHTAERIDIPCGIRFHIFNHLEGKWNLVWFYSLRNGHTRLHLPILKIH